MATYYSRQPIETRDGIPVFSPMDEYTKNYERISGDHLSHFNKTGENPWIPEYIWLQTEDSTAELIEKHARPGLAILDVGVGLGRLLSRFPELDRHGMDISFGYLKTLREMGGIEVCYSKIEDMPYAEGSFDIVVCTDVLEHVFDLSDACRRILSVLKPDGVLIVRTPHKEDLSGYLQPDYPYEFVHMRTFDVPSMRLHFEKTLGCKVLETTVSGYMVWNVRRRRPVSDREEVLLRELLDEVPKSQQQFLLPAVLKDRYEAFEINAVITKPGATPQPHMTYIPKPSEKLNDRVAALEEQAARFAGNLAAAREAAEKREIEVQAQLAAAAESVRLAGERVMEARQLAAAAEQKAAEAELRAAKGKSSAQAAVARREMEKEQMVLAKRTTKFQQQLLQSAWVRAGMTFGFCRKVGKWDGSDYSAKLDSMSRTCVESGWFRLGAKLGSKKISRLLEMARAHLAETRAKG